MSSTIIRPFTKYILQNPIVKKISIIPAKKLGLYAGIGSLSSLGLFRGYQEYFYFEIKGKKTSIEIKDYLCWSVYALINASLYVNPTISIFAISYEYERAKMLMSNKYDEKTYYTNPYFGLFTDSKFFSDE